MKQLEATPSPPGRDRNVRSLQRGLRVLGEVSASGGLRAGEIAHRVGLSRPTTYRLLETLEEQGFVSRSASDDRFRVTARARSLGSGYEGSTALSQVAGPALIALGRRLVWPVDLVTCQAGAMVILETTHARSPLSLDHGMIGMRLPLLRTAGGRAYLSYCSPEEREAVLAHLRRIDDAADRPLLGPSRIKTLVETVLAAGYATRNNTGLPIAGTSATKTHSIAVPILSSFGLHGCLVVIWLAKAVSFADAISQFLPPMRDVAATIGRDLGSTTEPSVGASSA